MLKSRTGPDQLNKNRTGHDIDNRDFSWTGRDWTGILMIYDVFQNQFSVGVMHKFRFIMHMAVIKDKQSAWEMALGPR